VFATALANGVKSFGMWFPNTDPSGSGLIAQIRFRGQEGAAEGAPMHTHLGVVGVTGILMRELKANPLEYVEGGPLNRRRVELSAILDSTDPDLSAFKKRGGKPLVVITQTTRWPRLARRWPITVGHRQDGPSSG
jgi:feruloyl esterase